MKLKKILSEFTQYFGAMIVRNICKVFWVVPVQAKKIYCEAYTGTEYSCSPKYITEYIKENFGDEYDVVWGLRDIQKEMYPGVRPVRFFSIARAYEFATSSILIGNCGMPTYLPKRKGQYMINTWHGGGAYKYCGENFFHDMPPRKALNRYKARCTDLVISSCQAFSEKALPDLVYQYDGEILRCGLPRNDVFFAPEYESIRKAERERLGVKDEIVVLYAPTFRGEGKKTIDEQLSSGNTSDTVLDTDAFLHAVEQRFGRPAKMLFRAHRALKNDNGGEKVIIDVTGHPDMQRLLCATDILISDYSSCIWDFSLMKKPCFLYLPDLDYYRSADRGFYTPIETWPAIMAQTNEELKDAVLGFDEDAFLAKVDKHHRDMGSYENGTACEQVYRRLCLFWGSET